MYRLGIIINNNEITAGVVNTKCEIVGTDKLKIKTNIFLNELICNFSAIFNSIVKRLGIQINEVESIGIALHGVIDPENGIICYSQPLGFNNIPIAQIINNRLGVNCYAESISNASAYGEYLVGSGVGTNVFLNINFDNDLSGGIIVNGNIYGGFNYNGEEFGHNVIIQDGQKCNCGRNGCFSAYASTNSLISQVRNAIMNDKYSNIWRLCNGDITSISEEMIINAFESGDKTAKKIIDEYLNYVVLGIDDYINMYHPEVVSIGGGIFKENEKTVKLLSDKVFVYRNLKSQGTATKIKQSLIENKAAIIGAAFLEKLYK